MTILRYSSLALASLLWSPPVLAAQALDSLKVGEAIKVWSPKTGTEGTRATWMGLVADSAVLRLDKRKEIVRIPEDSLWRLEVRNGNVKARGALLGALPGVVVGGFGGWLASTGANLLFRDCAHCHYGPLPSEKEKWDQEDRAMARKVGIVGAGVGTVLGAWYGSRHFAPRWTNVNLGNRVGALPSISVSGGSRFQIAAGYSF